MRLLLAQKRRDEIGLLVHQPQITRINPDCYPRNPWRLKREPVNDHLTRGSQPINARLT